MKRLKIVLTVLAAIIGVASSAPLLAQVFQPNVERETSPPLYLQLQKEEFETSIPVPQPPDPKYLYRRAIEVIARRHIALCANSNYLSTFGVTPETKFIIEWNSLPNDLQTLEQADARIKAALSSLGYRFDSYRVPKEDNDPESHVGIGVEFHLKNIRALYRQLKNKLSEQATHDQVKKAIIISNEHYLQADPLKDGPAAKAGMLDDDIFRAIDGKDINGMSFAAVLKLLEGQAGTTVEIVIERMVNGVSQIHELTITRDNFRVPVVKLKNLGNDTFYVKLITFEDVAASAQVKEAWTEVKNKMGKKLIFDLRNNGGGLITNAIDIASYIIPEGFIVALESRERAENSDQLITTRFNVTKYVRITTKPDQYGNNIETDLQKRELVIPPDVQVVILTNENTASASEMFTGAMLANGRGVTIGTRTFGKGVGQRVITLPYGRELHVTSLNFYPGMNEDKTDDQQINYIGLPATVEVKDDPESDDDVQLQAAIRTVNGMYDALLKKQAERKTQNAKISDQKHQEWKHEQEAIAAWEKEHAKSEPKK